MLNLTHFFVLFAEIVGQLEGTLCKLESSIKRFCQYIVILYVEGLFFAEDEENCPKYSITYKLNRANVQLCVIGIETHLNVSWQNRASVLSAVQDQGFHWLMSTRMFASVSPAFALSCSSESWRC